MTNGVGNSPVPSEIGHGLVRSGPWRFENADNQTRQMFDLPDGNVAGVPLFISDSMPPSAHTSDALDVTIMSGAAAEGTGIAAKLLPVDRDAGLYSAVFFGAKAEHVPRERTVTQQDMQHRISNCLAVIRSIFRRTAQASADTDTLISHFLGRLDAFSRIQSNIALFDTYGVALDELILDEFMAHATRTGERLSVEGPSIRLRTRPAETLSLAIHELATNSIKFGALGADAGEIAVNWHYDVDDDGSPLLCLMWDETGVMPDREDPPHRGFGTDMIENNMAFELGAKSTVRLEADGYHLNLKIPVTDQLLHSETPSERIR